MGTTKQHFFSPISLQVIHKFTKCILEQMVQLWPLVAKGNDYIVSSVMLLFFNSNAVSLLLVMHDIIGTMFNKRFMEELFKPQDTYSKKAMRTVFDRLAHASIMRLNSASMDKVGCRFGEVN